MTEPRFVPLAGFRTLPPEEMRARAEEFRRDLARRRTVHQFSPHPVPRDVIVACLRAAGSAPSGANMQPWHFVLIGDPEVKRWIRAAAEVEEREFYAHRAPPEWLEALAPLGTDDRKPFLETAPWLIAVFVQRYGVTPDGRRFAHYYAVESVGLATLTHTPSPMAFLSEILGRSERERPFLLLVVGHPAADAVVPDIQRKPLDAFVSFV